MKLPVLFLSIIFFMPSCSQNEGPGFQFELFKNSNSWELAKAIQDEDVEGIEKELKRNDVNINFQEPEFGNTLLHLAVANDKLVATKVLLEHKADINIRDFSNKAAIHEATDEVKSRKNSYKILDALIKYGADVNMIRNNPNENDTLGFSVPLMGAINDLDCTKLLLDHGANLYVSLNGTYYVWYYMLLMGFDDNILVAKYLIVDRKLLIPNPIAVIDTNRSVGIYDLLNKLDFNEDENKQEEKTEILAHLKYINYPENRVYIPKE